MRKYWYAAVAAATALFTVLMAGPASASHAVLTYGSVDGTAVAVNDTLTGSGTATFYSTTSGSTGVTCSSTFSATVTSNPPAPGTATETVTLSFSNCTENILGVIGVQSVVADNQPYNGAADSSFTVTITAGGSGPIGATVKLNTLLGPITCRYRSHSGSVVGTASNTDNSLTITNSQFDKTNGPSTCFSVAYFSVKYVPVSGSGGNVFTN